MKELNFESFINLQRNWYFCWNTKRQTQDI